MQKNGSSYRLLPPTLSRLTNVVLIIFPNEIKANEVISPILGGGGRMKSVTVVEILVTYISLGWAYVLLTTPGLFSDSIGFSLVEDIFKSEFALGVIVLSIALIKVVGMAMRLKTIRWIGLILSSVFWCFIAATQIVATGDLQINTGFIVYSGVAVMCLWTSKEVFRNGGQ